MTPTETRHALKAAGFSPIPCKGKAPLIDGWQTKLDISDGRNAPLAGGQHGHAPSSTLHLTLTSSTPEATDAVARG